MSTKSIAISVVSELKSLGVDSVVLCSGARNAPLVCALEGFPDIRVYDFYHENAAGFFALGLAKSGRKPAVFTTSGTAVAQLLSPCIEAFYDEQFIAFVSADRPARYRATGAPQAIEQKNILSDFVSCSIDIKEETDLKLQSIDRDLPLHINVCFDEPLWFEHEPSKLETTYKPKLNWKKAPEEQGAPKEYESKLKEQHEASNIFSSLFVISRLSEEERAELKNKLCTKVRYVFLEKSAGLKRSDFPAETIFFNDFIEIEKCMEKNYISSIVGIGGVPTTKLWRVLGSDDGKLPVFCFGRGKYSGIPGVVKLRLPILTELTDTNSAQINLDTYDKIKKQVQIGSQTLESLAEKYPDSEYNMIFNAWQELAPGKDILCVGNSMPIRYLDLMQSFQTEIPVWSNRGANGIDGQIASFLGQCVGSSKGGLCLLGDLSFLYDVSGGLWALKFCKDLEIDFIVVNNGGGRIFDRVFTSNPFLNSHSIPCREVFHSLITDNSLHNCREIFPDNHQTDSFWKDWGEL